MTSYDCSSAVNRFQNRVVTQGTSLNRHCPSAVCSSALPVNSHGDSSLERENEKLETENPDGWRSIDEVYQAEALTAVEKRSVGVVAVEDSAEDSCLGDSFLEAPEAVARLYGGGFSTKDVEDDTHD